MNAPRTSFLIGQCGPLAEAGRNAPGALRRRKRSAPGAGGGCLTIPLTQSVLALLAIVRTHDGHRSEAETIWHLVTARARNIGLVDGAARPAEKPVASGGVEPFAAGGDPAPEGASSSRPSSGAGFSLLTVPLSEADLLLLRLVGAHDRVEDEAELISKLVAGRAAEIGIARLADVITCEAPLEREGVPSGALPLPQVSELQGRAAAARLAHNQEVTGSSPVPATSSVSERARVPDREGCPPVALPEPPGPP